jgi:hypothetical protein
MQLEVTWAEIKRHAAEKVIPMQWAEVSERLYVCVVDSGFALYAILDPASADATEFNTTYKAASGKRLESMSSPFTSKMVGTKKIYARTTGLQFVLAAGANTVTYTATLPWVKITGVEVIGAETLDFVDFKVKDTAAGTYSGVPNYMLNQFGFAVNVPKDYYKREATFDADLYQGMVLEFIYTSVSAKTIGVNLIMAEVK